jgi:hypothetical protein
MAPSASKVFISYNRADRDWAEWIAGAIESAGYEPIIQAWHFRPGENFVLRMQEAAEQTDFTIAVLSETYLKSEFTQPEWAAAFAQDPTGPFQGIGPHPGLQPETGKTIDANERIKVLEIRPPFPPGNPPDVRDASVWIRFQRLSWPKPVA